MATARQDYEDFVRWVHAPTNNVRPDIRRFANLVLEHFDRVQATSLQRSQRSGLLAPLAQRHLAATPDTLPTIAQAPVGAAWQWRRLRHLSVGPFRGFRQREPFDLTKRIVLFYGPNGSGKTSLCEALEHALLGSVEEADVKRIAQGTYLANLHERRFDSPILIATDHRGAEVRVTPSADAYRFFFIEKNRIDSFSRIAARPSAQKAELIATLFGMDKFNEFVNHFNEDMDRQLTLGNAKRLQLQARRSALEQDIALVSGEAASLQELTRSDAQLAEKYAPGTSYEELKNLFGTEAQPSRLQELNESIDVLPTDLIGITRVGVKQRYEDATIHSRDLAALQAGLAQRLSDVSFKDLYGAVLALQPTEGDHCPACDTPLDHVHRDPYQKATAGLTALKELAHLQDRAKSKKSELTAASRELRAQWMKINSFLTSHGKADQSGGEFLSSLPEESVHNWWEDFFGRQEHSVRTLDDLLAIADLIELQDAQSRATTEKRRERIAERHRLIQYQLLVQAQDNRRQQFIQSVTNARERITNFEEANATLIREADEERIGSERDTPIKAAYDGFYALIRRYRNELPARLMAGLNDTAMELYNGFNSRDLDVDKLSALHLPLTAEGKIEICFRGNAGMRVDALKVLSEGHIRCLGLAILLAKALSLESPVIVFDDAINAIDSDHRRGIRETIFESPHFQNTQLLVTCHSQEFIKDIQNGLTAAARADSQVYLFRHHTGNYHPRVTGNLASRSYVEMARAHLDELNDRGALDACRKAVEMFAEKIWRWLASHEHGQLTVVVRHGSEPDLRSVCESLSKKLSALDHFEHDHRKPVVDVLGRILGIPAQNNVWRYLNKGTHEEADGDDFERERVEEVVQAMETLEALNLRPHR